MHGAIASDAATGQPLQPLEHPLDSCYTNCSSCAFHRVLLSTGHPMCPQDAPGSDPSWMPQGVPWRSEGFIFFRVPDILRFSYYFLCFFCVREGDLVRNTSVAGPKIRPWAPRVQGGGQESAQGPRPRGQGPGTQTLGEKTWGTYRDSCKIIPMVQAQFGPILAQVGGGRGEGEFWERRSNEPFLILPHKIVRWTTGQAVPKFKKNPPSPPPNPSSPPNPPLGFHPPTPTK